jgi:squalene-hopene/tetraprenyl-beta-curcumene cyclase
MQLSNRLPWLILALALAPGVFGLTAARSEPKPDAPAAAQKALDWIQQDAVKWRKEKTCASCHQGVMTLWVMAEAKSRGYAIAPEALAETAKWSKERLAGLDQPRDRSMAFSMLNTPVLYFAMMAHAIPSQDVVSADELRRISGHLVRYQEADGNWAWSIAPAQNRPPPYFDGDDVVTVMADTMLQPEAGDARQKADGWLAKNPRTDTTQSDVMRLLAAVWGGKRAKATGDQLKPLLGRQNSDGGWSPAPGLPSDAYGTGQAVYALRLAGMEANREPIRRGIDYLVRTQREDGSWLMTPRANPGATPFKNASPIIHIGSAWATLALLRCVGK